MILYFFAMIVVVVVVAIFNHYSKLLVHKYTVRRAGRQAIGRTDRQTDRPYSFISSSLMFPSFLLCLALFCFSCYCPNVDDTRTHIHFPQKNTLEEKKYCTILFSWWLAIVFVILYTWIPLFYLFKLLFLLALFCCWIDF